MKCCLFMLNSTSIRYHKMSLNLCTFRIYTHTHMQRCIASNESSGIDIVVSVIQTDLTALEESQEKAMELKVEGREGGGRVG